MSLNLTNLSAYSNQLNTIKWDDLIIQSCHNWKGYSTNAHNTYIVLVGALIFIQLLRLFFKQDYHIYFMINEDYNVYISLYLFSWLRDLIIGVLVVRIIQVWYIINFVLVG